MNRNLFNGWGEDLNPEEFSIALAGLAVFGPLTVAPTRKEITSSAKRSVIQKSPPIVKAWLPNITSAIEQIKKGGLKYSAQVHMQLWKTFFMHLAEDMPICIELNSKHKYSPVDTSLVDVFWILQELQRTGGAAGSAYFNENKKELPVAFELPLRFGVLDDYESKKLASIVDSNNWRHLYEIILPQSNILQCDIMLLPFDLKIATEMVRDIKIEADCVILMRGVGTINTMVSLTLISDMRKTVKTGGFSIVTIPEPHDRNWLNYLVQLLSHDVPLINALPEVQKEIVSRTTENLPLTIASRRLVQGARAKEFTSRLAIKTRTIAPHFKIEADLLTEQIESGNWNSELGDATKVIQIRKDIEKSLGQSLTVPRFGETIRIADQHQTRYSYGFAAGVEEVYYEPDLQNHEYSHSLARIDSVGKPSRSMLKHKRFASEHRRVVIDLYDITDLTSRTVVEDRLLPNHRYEVALYIAALREGTAVASNSFPRDELPPGDNELSVHFVPLVRGVNGHILASQYKSLVLPDTSDSDACQFEFNIPPLVETYRARFIISYHNRVLQTLILSAPVGSTDGNFLLEVENLVDHSFEKLPDRPRFDAAIIVNDSPSGASGLITVIGNEAIFTEPVGLKTMSDAIRQIILDEAAFPPPRRKYNSKQVKQLLHKLSRTGKILWEILPDEVKTLFQGTPTRIQLVDVRIGAYFPAEFVHPVVSPIEGASLCPNGEAMLKCVTSKTASCKLIHSDCQYKNDKNYICPARMWGLDMVIERQPATGSPTLGFTLRDVTDQTGKANKDVFKHIVLAVSEKVTRFAKEETSDLVRALKGKSVKVSKAENWESLKKIIHDDSPTLLILLPHSGVDSQLNFIPALELGGTWLALDHFTEEYVRGSKSVNPVVLLLGCDTNASEIPFLNFIKPFKDYGASMVIGTITQIEAIRTVKFVERFLKAVNASINSVTFGELLLQVRCSMLAEGDGYALSLLAYGDSDN